MKTLLDSILTPDVTSITPFAVVRQRLPAIRRDELLIGLANSGYSLSMISDVAHVGGVRLA